MRFMLVSSDKSREGINYNITETKLFYHLPYLEKPYHVGKRYIFMLLRRMKISVSPPIF